MEWSLIVSNPASTSNANKKDKKLDPKVGYVTSFEYEAPKNSSKKTVQSTRTEVSLGTLKAKKAWDIALASAKSIPMNAIMMYMSGNSLAIFSIMITGMMLFQPFKALMSVNKVFEKLELDDPNSNLTLQKATYLGLNLVVMGMGLYKCAAMGLLPTSTSDWLAFETRATFEQILATGR